MEFAVPKSRNESDWSDHKVGYMSRFSRRAVFWQNYGQLPASAPPSAVASFNGSSINAVPANPYSHRYVTFRLGSYTRRELKELKNLLISDLERVRALRHRISSPPKVAPKQYYQESLPFQRGQALQSLKDSSIGKKSEKSAGQKRTMPFSSADRETKKQCPGGGNGGGMKFNSQRSKVLLLKKCGQILTKLMQHKHGWVFNKPVDTVALGLHDYSSVIKTPMDLGTIKSKLGQNMYKSALAFASDVRLTFQNAILYNGKGSDVYDMAECLLSLFEDMFRSAKKSLKSDQAKKCKPSTKVHVVVENPDQAKKCKPSTKVPVVVENSMTTVAKKSISMARKSAMPGSRKAANLGNSMARNVTKREMTREEMTKLATSLSNLQMGPEGMDQIMEIVKKRVPGLTQEGDEIELDIEDLDNETLWELHSFVSLSKKAAENAKMTEGIVTNLVSPVQANNPSLVSEHPLDEQDKRKEAGEEEEIDIGEDIPITSFPSVWIEKDGVNISSSGSSSSSSGSDSSVSDSDSGTSSGDVSDEEEAHSTPPEVN